MRSKLFIDGQWVEAEDGGTFPSFAPSTGEHIADLAKGSRADAVKAVEAARRAFDDGPWPRMSGGERAAVLRRAAELLAERQPELSPLEARDGGGTMRKALYLDVPGAVGSIQYFAGCAE